MQYIIDQLTASGAFGQVEAAPLHTTLAAISTADELVALFSGTFGGRVYALHRGTEKTNPSMVYSLVSIERYTVGPYVLTHQDRYVLEVRADSLASLVTAVDAVSVIVRDSTLGLHVTDMAMDWDNDTQEWGCMLELLVALPSTGSGVTPAALVVPLGRTWQSPGYDNVPRQLGTRKHLVVTLTAGADAQTLEQAAIDAVQGKQGPGYFTPIRLASIEPVDLGGLAMSQLLIEHDQIDGA